MGHTSFMSPAQNAALFLIDDAWEENENGRRYAVDKSCGQIARQSSDINYAGREDSSSALIHFAARIADVSRQILIASTRLRQEDFMAVLDTLQAVLGVCGGITMALVVAGSALEFGLRFDRVVDPRSGLGYMSELPAQPTCLLHGTFASDLYPYKLFSALFASLSMPDKNVT